MVPSSSSGPNLSTETACASKQFARNLRTSVLFGNKKCSTSSVSGGAIFFLGAPTNMGWFPVDFCWMRKLSWDFLRGFIVFSGSIPRLPNTLFFAGIISGRLGFFLGNLPDDPSKVAIWGPYPCYTGSKRVQRSLLGCSWNLVNRLQPLYK